MTCLLALILGQYTVSGALWMHTTETLAHCSPVRNGNATARMYRFLVWLHNVVQKTSNGIVSANISLSVHDQSCSISARNYIRQ